MLACSILYLTVTSQWVIMTMVSLDKFSTTALRLSIQRLLRLCRPLYLALPLWAASCGLASAESWKVNLQDADIKAFINEVATITDQNFVLEEWVLGVVQVEDKGSRF